MKVLLVYPQDEFMTKGIMPPLGLAYIASYLEKNGHEVKILDNQIISKEDILKEAGAYSPDLVGINCLTTSRFRAFEFANKIKEDMPNTTIVMGGHHVTFTVEDTLTNVKSVDYIVRGEGEEIVLDLVNTIEKKENIKEVKGICFRLDEKIVQTPPRPPMKNITGLWPAWHLLDIHKYDMKISAAHEIGKGVEGSLTSCTMISTRGCPIGCVFCSVTAFSGPYYRAREAKDVVDEMEYLKNKFNLEAIHFWDSFFSAIKKRTFEICEEMIKRKIDMPWFCEVRVGSVDKETLELMKKAGCYHIAYGIETGSERVLKTIHKQISLTEAQKLAAICKETGIQTRVFFMMNHPGETIQEALETIRFREKYDCNVSTIGPTAIYPGTDVERYAKQIGTFPKDFSWAKPFYDHDLRMFNYNPHVPLFEQPGFGKKEVWSLMLEVRKHENLLKKLSGVKNRIRFIKSFSDIKSLAKVSAIGFKQYIINKNKVFYKDKTPQPTESLQVYTFRGQNYAAPEKNKK